MSDAATPIPPAIQVRALRVPLGGSGVEVSRLCLGLGTTGRGGNSVQAHLSVAALADLLVAGAERGATWWDTSDDYGTHAHVRGALARVPRESVQVTTKIYARPNVAVRPQVERCLEELGTAYVDVLLLHEVDTPAEWDVARRALDVLHGLRQEGLVRAVGLSTHCIDMLECVAGDPAVQVILTNYNHAGIHMDADRRDYERAMQEAARSGQGVCAMKTLGEGALRHEPERALCHNLAQSYVHGVVVGVTSASDVQAACAVWERFRAEGTQGVAEYSPHSEDGGAGVKVGG